MHIFITLIISVQSLKSIACKPREKLITQTCYPTLKANLIIVLSRKCSDFVKNYFFACKSSHAHFQYIHNKYASFHNDPLKTVREVDYTNSIPDNSKSCLKCLSSKGCNSVKIISSSTKSPQAHFLYVHIRRQCFKKIHLNLWEELIIQTLKCNERTDRQTDGQTRAILMPLTIVTGGGGHKKLNDSIAWSFQSEAA